MCRESTLLFAAVARIISVQYAVNKGTILRIAAVPVYETMLRAHLGFTICGFLRLFRFLTGRSCESVGMPRSIFERHRETRALQVLAGGDGLGPAMLQQRSELRQWVHLPLVFRPGTI
jgi:hypothetical protein